MEKQNLNPNTKLKDEELDEVTGGGAFDSPLCTLCGQSEQVSVGLCQSCLDKIMAERDKKYGVTPGVNAEGWPRL